MKAFEVLGRLNDQGHILLDEPLAVKSEVRVKVIVLISDQDEFEAEDTPIEEVEASLVRALQDAKAGRRIPLEQMWEGIDVQ